MNWGIGKKGEQGQNEEGNEHVISSFKILIFLNITLQQKIIMDRKPMRLTSIVAATSSSLRRVSFPYLGVYCFRVVDDILILEARIQFTSTQGNEERTTGGAAEESLRLESPVGKRRIFLVHFQTSMRSSKNVHIHKSFHLHIRLNLTQPTHENNLSWMNGQFRVGTNRPTDGLTVFDTFSD